MASPKRAAVPATIFQNHALFVPSLSKRNDYDGKFRRVPLNRICQSNEILTVRNSQMHIFPEIIVAASKGNTRFGQVIEK